MRRKTGTPRRRRGRLSKRANYKTGKAKMFETVQKLLGVGCFQKPHENSKEHAFWQSKQMDSSGVSRQDFLQNMPSKAEIESMFDVFVVSYVDVNNAYLIRINTRESLTEIEILKLIKTKKIRQNNFFKTQRLYKLK